VPLSPAVAHMVSKVDAPLVVRPIKAFLFPAVTLVVQSRPQGTRLPAGHRVYSGGPARAAAAPPNFRQCRVPGHPRRRFSKCLAVIDGPLVVAGRHPASVYIVLRRCFYEKLHPPDHEASRQCPRPGVGRLLALILLLTS